MKCPIDNVDLQMTDRQGVEIDYCPQCRGVWLDRGELDKIIERSAAPTTVSNPVPQERNDSRYAAHEQRPHKKRESFLSDIFDF